MCVCLVCLPVCLFAYNLGMGRAIVSKFLGYLQCAQGMVLGTKYLGVIGRWPQNLQFLFPAALAGKA